MITHSFLFIKDIHLFIKVIHFKETIITYGKFKRYLDSTKVIPIFLYSIIHLYWLFFAHINTNLD